MSLQAYQTVINVLGEASLLVSGKGDLLARNAAAERWIEPPSLQDGQDEELFQFALLSDHDDFLAYLGLCSRSRSTLVGSLKLRTPEGPLDFKTKGAVLRPRQGDDEAIILLQLFPKHEANVQFAALSERIEELNLEILKRRNIEHSLRAQKEWLQVTLTSIGDAVITTDRDGRVTFLNPIAEKLTGWPRDEALGRSLGDIFLVVDETTRERTANPVDVVLEEDRIVNLAKHSVLLTREGAEVPIADTAAPIRLNERLEGVVLVFHDVSQKRNLEKQLIERAEKLEEANRRKNTFLAMLAHELRNPLAPITNAVQLLKLDPSLANEAHRILDRQTRHLNRLVNDLLEVSRITQGKVSVNREPLDIASLVRMQCTDSMSQFEKKGIGLNLAVPEKPVRVMADGTRITQVLDNLLNNACKYTPVGGQVTVSLSLRNRKVWITIEDTGTGIERGLMENLFTAFTQGDQSLDRKEGGLGLGLALSKGIVDLHGGRIFAESAGRGRGSKFTVVLPAGTASGAEKKASPSSRGERPSVLLIEDNPDQAKTMCLLLEHLGSNVHLATDGLQGVQKATELHPDLIICDIGLPMMDGFDVARTLRQNSQTATIRMVALTGYGQDDFVERARQAGFDRHFLKPMSIAEIEEVMVR